ncbi:unnamed protein product, partial [Ectocarpus sp. 12 AP-2014]
RPGAARIQPPTFLYPRGRGQRSQVKRRIEGDRLADGGGAGGWNGLTRAGLWGRRRPRPASDQRPVTSLTGGARRCHSCGAWRSRRSQTV